MPEGIPYGTEATERSVNRESSTDIPMPARIKPPNTGAVPVRDGDICSGSPVDRRSQLLNHVIDDPTRAESPPRESGHGCPRLIGEAMDGAAHS